MTTLRAFRVVVPESDEDETSAILWEAGTVGIEVRPVPANPQGEGSSARLELLAYFPAATEPSQLSRLLPKAAIHPAVIPDVDWVARFREGFRAVRAGRFTIAPVWDRSSSLAADDAAEPRSRPDTLVVDPGRAFGTGTHETTRLCLSTLEMLAARRPLGRTLDLGSGTGLLAIAAARLGASPVVASDIDPEATSSSRQHAHLNHSPLRVVRADGGRPFRAGVYDLVLANLTAGLLIERAAEIQALLAPRAALVLSGLLTGDLSAVRDAFASLGPPTIRRDGEWAALLFERT